MGLADRFPLFQFLQRGQREKENAQYMLRADQLFSARNHDGAVRVCEQILAKTPKHTQALFLAGLACRETRHHADAIRYLDRLIALDRTHEDGCALLYRGLSHKVLGHTAEARADFEAAAQVSTLARVRELAAAELR